MTLAGEALSIVTVALLVSVPDWELVLVKEVTVPVTVYVEPDGAGILAWLFGVTLILNEVKVVVTGMPQLVRETVLEEGSV